MNDQQRQILEAEVVSSMAEIEKLKLDLRTAQMHVSRLREVAALSAQLEAKKTWVATLQRAIHNDFDVSEGNRVYLKDEMERIGEEINSLNSRRFNIQALLSVIEVSRRQPSTSR